MIKHEAFRQAVGDAVEIAGVIITIGAAGIVVSMLVALFSGNASVAHIEGALMAGAAWSAAGLAAIVIGRRLAR